MKCCLEHFVCPSTLGYGMIIASVTNACAIGFIFIFIIIDVIVYIFILICLYKLYGIHICISVRGLWL